MELGLVHLYWGEGKGKTTAAVGLALRALGSGCRVTLVQFLKGADTGEVPLLRALGADVTVSARRPRDLAWIELDACRAVPTASIGTGREPYDVVFNTIPAMIFPRRVLV